MTTLPVLRYDLLRCVTHWHFFVFTRETRAGRLRTYNSG